MSKTENDKERKKTTEKSSSAVTDTGTHAAVEEQRSKTGTAKQNVTEDGKTAKSAKAGTGKSKTKKTGGKKTGTGKTGTGKTSGKKTGTEKTGTGKTGGKKTGTGKSGTGKTGEKKTGTGTGTGKTGEKKTGTGTGTGKTGEKKTGTPSGRTKTKAKNPNLRLVKNGDIEVKSTKENSSSVKEKAKVKEKEKEYEKTYRDKPNPGEWMVQHKSLLLMILTVVAVVGILLAVYYYFIKTYTVTTVYVDGNVHYTNEEVMELVMTGRCGNNSLYLTMKYKDKGVEGVPFVEKMDVNILAPDTIRINVYEKALAGYVEYLGRYMYFDKDGIVVESSEIKTSGIPQVTGLKFDYVVLNEPLPVENDEIFSGILSITQLLTKYELTADKIFFDSDYDLTLYFGGVRVTLGTSSNIDEKIMRLQYILPELEGKSGTLQMENYTEGTKNITFNQEQLQ